MKKKNLLIFSFEQFGYLIDTLKYVSYSKDFFNITYLGWDYGLPKIEIEGVRTIYISRNGNILKRNYRLLRAFHKTLKNNFDVTFLHYTRGVSLIRLLNWQKK